MAKTTMFKLTVDNSKAFIRLMDEKKEEILTEAGRFVTGEAKLRAPVDTGDLRKSIKEVMYDDMTIQIGTSVEYSEYVEFGTSRQSPQPYLLPAYEENLENIKRIMRKRVAELGRGL